MDSSEQLGKGCLRTLTLSLMGSPVSHNFFYFAVNSSAHILFPRVNSCVHQMLNYSAMPIALSPSSVTNNRFSLSSRLCKCKYVCMLFFPVPVSSALNSDV